MTMISLQKPMIWWQ